MGLRGSQLYRIEQVLQSRGIQRRIDSVPALRSLFPGLKGRLDLDAIESQAETIDLTLWLNSPPKIAERPATRTGALSYEEIWARRSKGETYPSIATDAKLTSERVRQIWNLRPDNWKP